MSFAPFLDTASFAAEGVFTFRVASAALGEASSSVSLAAIGTKEAPPLVRAVLQPGTIKFASYSRGCFAEEIVAAEVSGVPDSGIAFALDQDTLARINRAFPSCIIDVSLDCRRRLLSVSEGRGKVELPTMPPTGLVEYSGKLGLPKVVGKVPTELLRQGLRYAGLLSTPGEAAANHLAVGDTCYTVRTPTGDGEVTLGVVAGGSEKGVLAFQSPSLLGLNFGLNAALREFVTKALTRLDPGQTTLYEAPNFSLLLDGTRLFGFERPIKPYTLESAVRHVRLRPVDRVKASRAALRQALVRVATVSGRSAMVQLSVSGETDKATLTVRMSDPSGRLAEDSLPVYRAQDRTAMYGQVRDAAVRLSVLSPLLNHFSAESVWIGFDGPTIRLLESVADATATSVLVCEANPAQGVQPRAA